MSSEKEKHPEGSVEAQPEMQRRDFLKTMALAGGAVVAAVPVVEAATGGGKVSREQTLTDQLTVARNLPSSDEVAKAAYDTNLTVQLVQTYQLNAIELSQLIERLPIKPVPW